MEKERIFSVSEISNVIKRTIETNFAKVKIKGEVFNLKKASSGHIYLSLKDDGAVINGIIWKFSAIKMSFSLEEGMELVVRGKITTYAGRSNYQIIIEGAEISGTGTLLKLLEERKKKLAKLGLFNSEHKKKLPYLPKTIAVITSETGAVIRDIIHRISDRCGSHVILIPTLVQGEGAEIQISNNIRLVSDIVSNPQSYPHLPKIDVLIVARGGGSLEDLWAFNDEKVAYATFECPIPVISAVGHETDTTLIDYVSDVRAPTPTGAAEICVPVKTEIQIALDNLKLRLNKSTLKYMNEKQNNLNLRFKLLVHPNNVLQNYSQRIDDLDERLNFSIKQYILNLRHKVDILASKLKNPDDLIKMKYQNLKEIEYKINSSMKHYLIQKNNTLELLGKKIYAPVKTLELCKQNLLGISYKLSTDFYSKINDKIQKFNSFSRLLQGLSYKKVLQRGYAVVRNKDGKIVANSQQLDKIFQVEFFANTIVAQKIHTKTTINKIDKVNKEKKSSSVTENNDININKQINLFDK